jgi:CCR4-NOT transcription complex subunit 2
MSGIQQKLEKIQQEEIKGREVLSKEKLSEIVKIVRNKPHRDPGTYYPEPAVSRMLPSCYPKSNSDGVFRINVEAINIDNLHEETLFYVFYSFPGDEMQMKAYNKILEHRYLFCRLYKCFVTVSAPLVADGVRRPIVMFDPFTWSKISKEVLFDDKFINSLER